jgi:hypothetical protein
VHMANSSRGAAAGSSQLEDRVTRLIGFSAAGRSRSPGNGIGDRRKMLGTFETPSLQLFSWIP